MFAYGKSGFVEGFIIVFGPGRGVDVSVSRRP